MTHTPSTKKIKSINYYPSSSESVITWFIILYYIIAYTWILFIRMNSGASAAEGKASFDSQIDILKKSFLGVIQVALYVAGAE